MPPYRPSALPPEEAFEKEILVKSEVAEVLARTLTPAKLAGSPLVIGTATDPYQPAERRFPIPIVAAHGLVAAATLVLVLLTAAGVGGS